MTRPPPDTIAKGAMVDTETLIATARWLLRPAPVRLHHVPNWLRRRILRTLGCRDGLTKGPNVLMHAVSRTTKPSASSWLDHWGSSRQNDVTVFVTEPYSVTEGCLQAVGAFCRVLHLEWYVSSNTWWFPGRTVRIVIYEPENPPWERKKQADGLPGANAKRP